MNGEIRGDRIVTRSFVNLGFAVEFADGKGLIVPVVKNAETLNLLGMAKGIADIAARARNKQLDPRRRHRAARSRSRTRAATGRSTGPR